MATRAKKVREPLKGVKRVIHRQDDDHLKRPVCGESLGSSDLLLDNEEFERALDDPEMQNDLCVECVSIHL